MYSAADAGAYRKLGLRGTTYAAGSLAGVHLLGDLRGRTVLDFGTGTGRTACLLSDRGASVVLAVDKDENMLRAAQQRPGVRYIKVTDTLPLPDQSVDAALCANVFPEFKELIGIESACCEIWRVLREESPFVAVVPNPASFECDYISYRYVGPFVPESGAPQDCLIKGEHPFIVQDYYWSQDDYVKTITAAGFKVTNVLDPLADRRSGVWLDETTVAADIVIHSIRLP